MRGQCEFCGCTDLRAYEDGCCWMDDTHTLCSNPACVGAAVWQQLCTEWNALPRMDVRNG
jgi:hypothetical protein